MEPVKVFISYAREDEKLIEKFRRHLKSLQRSGYISTWYDRDISPGSNWRNNLSINLDTAELFLLALSSDFIDSNFCFEIEMTRAIERHNQGKAIVLPIIFRPVDWRETPLAGIQALPRDAKPVTLWENDDQAYLDIVEGIKQVVKKFRSPPGAGSKNSVSQKAHLIDDREYSNFETSVTMEQIFDGRSLTYIKSLIRQIKIKPNISQKGLEWLDKALRYPPKSLSPDDWLYICLEFHLRFIGEEIMNNFSDDTGQPTDSYASHFFEQSARKFDSSAVPLGKHYANCGNLQSISNDAELMIDHLNELEDEVYKVRDFLEIYTALSDITSNESLLDEFLEKIDQLRAIYENLDAKILMSGHVRRETLDTFGLLNIKAGSFSAWLRKLSKRASFTASYFEN